MYNRKEIYFFKLVLIADMCDLCQSKEGPHHHSLVQKYYQFCIEVMLPEIQRVSAKYSVWWRFKPQSALKKYLESQIGTDNLADVFLPMDLKEAISDSGENRFGEGGNNQIIYLDESLQKIVSTFMIYSPDLEKILLPHVENAPNSTALKNAAIFQELYIQSSTDIIYSDDTSVFWLHPIINFMLTRHRTIVFSWNLLLDLFIDFCTSNKDCFSRVDEFIIRVNDNSPIANLLKFKFFHVNQIEEVLKNVTKFLGRRATIATSCPFLKLSLTTETSNVLTFIDDVINNNNEIVPSIKSSVYL
jgi:hypothetical protein